MAGLTPAEAKAALEAHGFLCGAREPTPQKGEFMVVEPVDYADQYKLPTKHGGNGPWCIVGPDLDALVLKVFELFSGDWNDVD